LPLSPNTPRHYQNRHILWNVPDEDVALLKYNKK